MFQILKAVSEPAKLTFIATALALTALVAAPANAQTNALTFTGGTDGNSSFNSTRGYAFNVTAPVRVTHLSFYDAGLNGLDKAHEVGIWDPSGTLIASATVGAGTTAPLLGDFRIVDIPDILLTPGNGYVVGAQFTPTQIDTQRFGWTSSSTAPGIEFVQGRIILDVTSLTRPTDTTPEIANGLIGGSFVVAGSVAAPEPGVLALFLPGMAMCIGMVRRKTR